MPPKVDNRPCFSLAQQLARKIPALKRMMDRYSFDHVQSGQNDVPNRLPNQPTDSLGDAPPAYSGSNTLFDYLTGLPNHGLVYDRLEQRVRHLRRDPKAIFAVLIIAIDEFHSITQSLGQSIGDQILVIITRRLQQMVRDSDTLGRLGGTEFVLVVDGVTGIRDVDMVIGRINKVLSKPVQLGPEMIHLCCSMGGVIAHDAVSRPNDLLRDADIALYEARKSDRGRRVIFNEAMGAAVSHRQRMERDLHHALTAHEFELVYQPIIKTQDGSLHGFETLIRWNHPQRGLIPPSVFIPLAEETGLILPIGQWAIDQAIQQLAEWIMAGLNVSVAVNVSPFQFEQASNLIQSLAYSLDYWNVTPHRLTLEVTETLISANPESAAQTLRQLSAMGVSLAIDDFGTGYSSLSRLMDLPFDTIKIDRAFIARVESDLRRFHILEGITHIAQKLGLDVVAEGIETPLEYAAISKIGCQYCQGFFFAPPLSASDASRLMRECRSQTGPFLTPSHAVRPQEPVK